MQLNSGIIRPTPALPTCHCNPAFTIFDSLWVLCLDVVVIIIVVVVAGAQISLMAARQSKARQGEAAAASS